MPDFVGFTEEVLHAVTNPILPAIGAVGLALFRTARSIRLLVALPALIAVAIEGAAAEGPAQIVVSSCAWAIAAAFWSEFLLQVVRPVLVQVLIGFGSVLRAIERWRSGR